MKDTKCQYKEHQNVFKNNLTEPNEYNKGYQMYKKIHMLDLLNRFKDSAKARRRLNISWDELSEAEVSHLESIVEKS